MVPVTALRTCCAAFELIFSAAFSAPVAAADAASVVSKLISFAPSMAPCTAPLAAFAISPATSDVPLTRWLLVSAYRLQCLFAAGFGSLQDSEDGSLGTGTDVTANVDDRLNGRANHAGRGRKQ